MGAVPFSQEIIFMTSFFGGVLLGLLWDLYRLFRYYIRVGRLGTAIGDIVYWIISLYFGLNIIIYISWGTIRLYILIGFMLGALIYFSLISSILLGFMIFILDLIILSIKKLYLIIIFPIKFFIKRLKILLQPYKIKLVTSYRNKKREIKFYVNEAKIKQEINKKKKQKKKKLERLIKEQRRNVKKIKSN